MFHPSSQFVGNYMPKKPKYSQLNPQIIWNRGKPFLNFAKCLNPPLKLISIIKW